MDTRGKLATADIWLPKYDQLQILVAIERMLEKYTVVNQVAHQFQPHGLTKVWVLAESHCAVHTYPEHNFIAVDLYTCSDMYNPMDCLATLKATLKATGFQCRLVTRGVRLK